MTNSSPPGSTMLIIIPMTALLVIPLTARFVVNSFRNGFSPILSTDSQTTSSSESVLGLETESYPRIISGPLPAGYLNRTYLASIKADGFKTGGVMEMSFSGLPAGVTKNYCGLPIEGGKINCFISGKPFIAGLYYLKTTVSDGLGTFISRDLPLRIQTPSGTY